MGIMPICSESFVLKYFSMFLPLVMQSSSAITKGHNGEKGFIFMYPTPHSGIKTSCCYCCGCWLKIFTALGENNPIRSRPEGAPVNIDWLEKFPISFYKMMPPICSDHSPIDISIGASLIPS